jgi:hypothetical protein
MALMFQKEYGKKKDVFYAYLRVFSCRVFVYISKHERFKLGSKTKQCVFLGSKDDDFGYRLYIEKSCEK